MRALIDGDILVYRCGFATEHTIYTLVDTEEGIPIVQYESASDMKAGVAKYGDLWPAYEVQRHKVVEPLSHALRNAKSVIKRVLHDLKADSFQVLLSQGDNFRGEIATMLKYKGNREGTPRPMHYDAIRTYLCEQYGATIFRAIEADDALAMLQTDDTVIVSIDKDLLQVPGKHYNWVTETKLLVTPEVGLQKLYIQLLTGDATDNIPGIHGIGPVKARAIITDLRPSEDTLYLECERLWDEYLHNPEAKHPVPISEGESGSVRYTTWYGEQVDRHTPEIVEEVLQLLTVGGERAQAVLNETGEELPRA